MQSAMVVKLRPPQQVRILLIHVAAVLLFLQQQSHVVESLASSSSISSSSYSYSKVENNNSINDSKKMIRSTNNNLKLRVVSYNVLSSHLASPSHFTTLNPDHLEAKDRLPVILAKLQDEISASKLKDDGSIAICCLQEVSYDWAGELHTFFANHNYHLVTGLYGKWYSGYMGVALAWPNDKVNVVNVDIARLSDTRPGGWPHQAKSAAAAAAGISGIASSVVDRVQSLLTGSIQTLLLLTRKVGSLLLPPPPEQESSKEEIPPDHWALSANRHNVLLTATLQCKTSGQTFCVANYHMPCAYYCPMAMTIHADLCAAHVQRLAAVKKSIDIAVPAGDDNNNNDDKPKEELEFYPYVLAGDFNIKPNEPVYRLLTTGKIDATSDATFFPTPTTSTTTITTAKGEKEEQVVTVEWTPSMQHAMKSAYAEHSADGKTESDFTNYARIKEEEPFIDTLDFIFYGPTTSSSSSPSWKVTDVATLPSRKDAGGPFPNLDKNEPSDHVLIAATLELQ